MTEAPLLQPCRTPVRLDDAVLETKLHLGMLVHDHHTMTVYGLVCTLFEHALCCEVIDLSNAAIC